MQSLNFCISHRIIYSAIITSSAPKVISNLTTSPSPTMKIAIFGSTGTTGACALQSALEKSHSVTVLVRDASKLPENVRDKVTIIVGDVLNYEDVARTLQGVEAVTVVLGTRNDLKPTTILSEGMTNIIKAMKNANINIVSVCLSAFLFYEREKVPPMFKDLNDDHQRQFDIIKNSNLNYICILPPHIADEEKSGYLFTLESSPGRVVSKYDLGDFLIASLSLPPCHGKVFGIKSKAH